MFQMQYEGNLELFFNQQCTIYVHIFFDPEKHSELLSSWTIVNRYLSHLDSKTKKYKIYSISDGPKGSDCLGQQNWY